MIGERGNAGVLGRGEFGKGEKKKKNEDEEEQQ